MSLLGRIFLTIAALSLCEATVLGAYLSHGLQNVLDETSLQSLQIAVDYQFYHSLGLLVVVPLLARLPTPVSLGLTGGLLVAGIVLFCGSIYATAAGAPSFVGQAAPLGGLCFIAGWLSCAYAMWRLKPHVLR